MAFGSMQSSFQDLKIEHFTTMYIGNTSPTLGNYAEPPDPKVTFKSVNTFVGIFVFVHHTLMLNITNILGF